MAVRRIFLTLALTVAAGLGATANANALVVSLADQNPASFADSRALALGIKYARMIVPWDAVYKEPQLADTWLATVATLGYRPQVAFEHSKGDKCPYSPCTLPSADQYEAAFNAFRARHPQVTTYTSWNEANHSSQPTARRPESAATYWQRAVKACPSCTIVAGDVLDSGDFVSWLQRYIGAAGTPAPQLWGVHNYSDVTYGRTSGTDRVLSTVPGRVWVEESGGIVVLRDDSGRATLSHNETRAADAIDNAFEIARGRSRIDRISIYQWKAGVNHKFDSGLVRPDNSERPSLDRLRTQLGISKQTDPPVTTRPVATGIRWTAKWRSKARTAISLVSRCLPARATCDGTLRITFRVGAKKWALKSRTLPGRTTLTVNRTLPSKIRRYMRTHKTSAVRVLVRTKLRADGKARTSTVKVCAAG